MRSVEVIEDDLCSGSSPAIRLTIDGINHTDQKRERV